MVSKQSFRNAFNKANAKMAATIAGVGGALTAMTTAIGNLPSASAETIYHFKRLQEVYQSHWYEDLTKFTSKDGNCFALEEVKKGFGFGLGHGQEVTTLKHNLSPALCKEFTDKFPGQVVDWDVYGQAPHNLSQFYVGQPETLSVIRTSAEAGNQTGVTQAAFNAVSSPEIIPSAFAQEAGNQAAQHANIFGVELAVTIGIAIAGIIGVYGLSQYWRKKRTPSASQPKAA